MSEFTKKIKILVVEDQTKWQKTWKDSIFIELSSDQYEVKLVDNFQEASETIKATIFDLVALNINLQGKLKFGNKLGFKLLEQIKKEYPTTKLILVTGEVVGDVGSIVSLVHKTFIKGHFVADHLINAIKDLTQNDEQKKSIAEDSNNGQQGQKNHGIYIESVTIHGGSVQLADEIKNQLGD